MIPLADTLVAFVGSLEPTEGSGRHVSGRGRSTCRSRAGSSAAEQPVFLAAVPHTRWGSGFLPQVHLAHVVHR